MTVDLLENRFADYSGNLTTRDNVDYIQGDGRTYLARTDNQYDIVWFVAPDSYAASNAATSGAFVLSESYLYTEEMIAEAYRHLTPDGMVVTQFGDFDFDQRISPDEVFIFSGVTIGGQFFDMVRQVPIKVGIADGTGFGWGFGSSSSSNTGVSQFITGWDYQIVNRGGPGTPIYTTFDPRPGFAPPPPGMDMTPELPPGEEAPSIPLPAGVWLLAGALGLMGLKGCKGPLRR